MDDIFKKIIRCLRSGGRVYEMSTDFHALGYLRTMNKNCIYLGDEDTKSVFLCIPANELADRDLYFCFYDKDGEDYKDQ